MGSSPLVSIGLPVYNGERHVADAIRSLQAQTVDDIEILISDNASTDDTEKIVRDLAAADDRIRYLPNDVNVGANRNFNRTFFFARGEFFKWSAHDDILESTFLERCLEVLDEDPSVVLAHTATRYVDVSGEDLVELERGYVGGDGYVERLTLDETVRVPLASSDPVTRFDAVVNRMPVFFDVFGVGRREAFRRTLLLRPYYGADKVFLAEMALLGPIVRDEEALFLRRCHDHTSSRSSDLGQLADWSDPRLRFAYYPMQMIAGYTDVVRASDLSAAQKRRCLIAIAAKFGAPARLLRGR